MPATLRLTRKHPLMELRRGPFVIELDGDSSVGSVNKLDETVEIPVDRATTRRRRGRQLPDPRTPGLAVYVAALVKPDLGVSLKRE